MSKYYELKQKFIDYNLEFSSVPSLIPLDETKKLLTFCFTRLVNFAMFKKDAVLDEQIKFVRTCVIKTDRHQTIPVMSENEKIIAQGDAFVDFWYYILNVFSKPYILRTKPCPYGYRKIRYLLLCNRVL